MSERPVAASNIEILSDRVAEDLLTRASELDAARASGTPVATLRAAAAEAGISAQAFDAALGELRAGHRTPRNLASAQRGRRRQLVAVAAGLWRSWSPR